MKKETTNAKCLKNRRYRNEKDTSLVTILSVPELMFYAKSNSNRLVSFMPLLIAGVFYFFMNWLVSVLFKKIEKKLSYYS